MEPSDHQMHIIHMVPGRICAALYDNCWHRGEVVRLQPNRKNALVHFIDYGTTTDVSIESIKYLHREFGHLPCQVYRGCLDYIRPAGGQKRWCRDSTYAFLAISYDVMLFAKVTAIDTKVITQNYTQTIFYLFYLLVLFIVRIGSQCADVVDQHAARRRRSN